MSRLSRRNLMRGGLFGLAAAGAGGLVLRADAGPTPATEDAHGYEEFLKANGEPRIQPTGKWAPTGEDILGPFYVEGAPFRGKVTPPLEPGELLVIRGRVWGYDTKKPLPGATLHVWQTDAKGRYDMDDPRHPPARSEFRNRIRLVTDETGFYEYETIKPAPYRVGRGFRPAHIHYMIEAPGYRKLITQLYFKGDPRIAKDRFARDSELIVDPATVSNDNGEYLRGTFDIVLERG